MFSSLGYFMQVTTFCMTTTNYIITYIRFKKWFLKKHNLNYDLYFEVKLCFWDSCVLRWVHKDRSGFYMTKVYARRPVKQNIIVNNNYGNKHQNQKGLYMIGKYITTRRSRMCCIKKHSIKKAKDEVYETYFEGHE